MDPRRLRYLNPNAPFGEQSDPPEGYVNLWVNNFSRWQKRWLVATTPGVLVVYKRANRLGGPVGFVDLAHASVMVADVGNPRQFLVVTGSRMFRIRALSKNSRLAWTRCLEGSAEAYSAAVALVRDRRLRYESQERGGGRLAGPLIPADVKSTEAAAAEAKQKLSALSREELLERCAELEVQNARLGLRLAAAERDDVRRDGSASSDTEDDDCLLYTSPSPRD